MTHLNLFICVLLASLTIVPAFVRIGAGRSTYSSNSLTRHTSLSAQNRWQPKKEESPIEEEEVSNKDSVYEVELPKRAGIDWGSDISFRWVYVLNLDPQGEAYKSGLVQKGDYIVGIGNVSTIAQDFDFVLTTLTKYPENRLNYTFFRGNREVLTGKPVLEPSEMNLRVTVQQDGKPDVILTAPGGTNLRQLLVSNGINVYRSLTRWTNCNGRQRCGTCIVDITEGISNCNRKALDEGTILAENPENYRLSCVTSVYGGDVVVKVQGAVGAAQWTR